MAMNLRGVRESGTAFAIPTYVFMAAILGMAAWGFLRLAFGDLPDVESAQFTLVPESGYEQGLTGLAGAFLLLRAFSSGCAALTGVEAISNGVPAFRKPKSKNAATTLLLLGAIAVTMLMSIIVLAKVSDIRFAENVVEQLRLNGEEGEPWRGGVQFPEQDVATRRTRSSASSPKAIFDDFPLMACCRDDGHRADPGARREHRLQRLPGARLDPRPGPATCRASCTPAATGSPSATASSSWPAFAIAADLAFDAEVTRLIQLYIVGVFVSFTLSQTGMVRHWTRLLRTETDPAARARMQRSRAINGVGLVGDRRSSSSSC